MKSTAPPAKADITGARLAASVGVNVFFLTNCLVELSVTNYALASDQLHFLQAFLRWRDASVIAWIMYDMMSVCLSLSRSLARALSLCAPARSTHADGEAIALGRDLLRTAECA